MLPPLESIPNRNNRSELLCYDIIKVRDLQAGFTNFFNLSSSQTLFPSFLDFSRHRQSYDCIGRRNWGSNVSKVEFKAVIYDFDGVIVDSLEANVFYYNRLLRHFGLPPVRAEHKEIIQTRTSREVIELLFDNPALIKEARALEKKMDNEEVIPLIKLEPFIKETLERLRKRYRTAIATNRGKSLPLVLEFHNLGQYFDETVSSAQVMQPKPHPEYLKIILRNFSLSPDQALYIGDAEIDARLAAAAGVPFVAYKNSVLQAWGYLNDHRETWSVLEP